MQPRGVLSVIWPIGSFIAVALAAGLLGVICFSLGREDHVQAWVPFTAFALTGALLWWWGSGIRAQRRLKIALDAYAERELARADRDRPVRSGRAYSHRRVARSVAAR
jgi:hypothetical protein